MQKSKANSNTRTGGGFSAIELLITATVLTIVTGVGVMGINRARASVRLAGAAREYAGYIEKARIHSIRSHADDGERATVTVNEDMTSYTVTMDLDGDGTLDSRVITLPDGVEFKTAESIAFDWRGRTWRTFNGITESNAQVSVTLKYNTDTVSIDVTGSGDITIDSDVFEDELPNVNLHVADLSRGATPTSPVSTATPTPTPDTAPTPDNLPVPTPTPPVNVDDIIPVPTPTPAGRPTATPTPTPSATPVPTPDAVPTPTPVPAVCTLSVDLPQLILSKDGTGTIRLSHNAGATLTITGSSSKPSDLQVTPGAQTVAGGGSASFTIKSKKTIGTYTATFSTSCGSKSVPVIVISTSLF